jgi:low temperature requirement protein LtrA
MVDCPAMSCWRIEQPAFGRSVAARLEIWWMIRDPDVSLAVSKTGRPAHFRRPREAHSHARVTNVELFFDLVFVFAVTQLSHHLLKNLTLMGTLHTCLLFVAVWWVWIYTSWVTNWLDPERTPVRLLPFGLMLAGLVLATSIPQAFGARGLQFAAAYVAMQVGRSLFMLWALGAASPSNRRNFQRITVWFAASAAFWLAGAFVGDNARFALWAVAFAIEFVAPSLGYFVPGLGRSKTGDWISRATTWPSAARSSSSSRSASRCS